MWYSNCWALICLVKQQTPLHIYDLTDALKSCTSSITCEMTVKLSKSTYGFIKSGIIGKCSSNFMLHYPRDASISLWMWSTIENIQNSPWKWLISKTIFYIFLAQLFSWNYIEGGNYFTITSSLRIMAMVFFPANAASYSGVNLVFSTNDLEE